MKKYTIKDSWGNKKIVYAKDIVNAMSFVDSKMRDMGQHVPGAIVPAHQIYNPEYSIKQFKSYIGNVIRDLYGNEYNKERVRAISKLDTYVSQIIDDFKADIKNSNLDKKKTVQYYIQYVDALYKEITDVKNIQNIDGQSLNKIDDIYAKMDRSIHDSNIRDIDASSLMTLFTKYGKPYGYTCKTKPKMSSSGSKYLGQLTAYTLSPIGKYNMNKAEDLVDFLNRKGYEASIFAPNIIVTLKQDRSSRLYKSGHEKVSQYNSIKDSTILYRGYKILANYNLNSNKVNEYKIYEPNGMYLWSVKSIEQAKKSIDRELRA